MIVQSCSQLTTNSILKTKGQIKLLPSSISVTEVKTQEIPDPRNIYKLNCSTFQLYKGVIPLDVIHHMDHKTQQTIKITIFNINNIITSLETFDYSSISSNG